MKEQKHVSAELFWKQLDSEKLQEGLVSDISYIFRSNYSTRTMLPSNVLTAGIILLVTMSPAARSHVLKKPGVHHHHSASCREVSSLLESLQSGSFTACNQHPAVSKYEVEMMAD